MTTPYYNKQPWWKPYAVGALMVFLLAAYMSTIPLVMAMLYVRMAYEVYQRVWSWMDEDYRP